MKIRQGFVSNSSSSSFIVAFPKELELSVPVVQHLLFGENKVVCAYDHLGSISTESAAEQVVNDMIDQKPNDSEAILEALNGYAVSGPNLNNFKFSPRNEHGDTYDWEAYNAACDVHKQKMYEKIRNEFGDQDVYVFEYADENGSFFATLEHGGIFDNLPHMNISNH